MRERKYIKFRVDMFEDTKMKIIDMKPERDLIHYVCARFITLAGKVNREGELYLSKNIPYTVETLAIEFNRDVDQVKLALDVLMELEILELTEDNIYRVINFAKHQNINVKEKVKTNDKKETETDIKSEEVLVKENLKNKEVQVKENLNSEIYDDENKAPENKIDQNEKYERSEEIRKSEEEDIKRIENAINHGKDSLEINQKDIEEADNNMSSGNSNDKAKASNVPQDNMLMLLEVKKNNKGKKRKKNELNMDAIDEEPQDDGFITFYDNGERPLGEDERVVGEWTF